MHVMIQVLEAWTVAVTTNTSTSINSEKIIAQFQVTKCSPQQNIRLRSNNLFHHEIYSFFYNLAENLHLENKCFVGDDAVWNKMYVGCWEDKNVNTMFDKDDHNSRDFEIYIADSSQEWKGGMTLNRCVPACVTLGYRYAALQVKGFKFN